jgi:hypothetical protein
MNPTVTRSLGLAAAFVGRATAAVAPASIVVFMKSRRFMASLTRAAALRTEADNPQTTRYFVRRVVFFFGGAAFFGGAG